MEGGGRLASDAGAGPEDDWPEDWVWARARIGVRNRKTTERRAELQEARINTPTDALVPDIIALIGGRGRRLELVGRGSV
jgi:hypothetical protein